MSDAEQRQARVLTLERELRRLTALLYDTRVPAERLEREVAPYLAESVTFTDPWQTGVGKANYRLGMAGFHAMFRFRFKFHQVTVQLDERGERGRALIDGVMQLEQLRWLFTYPLRTLLVFDFVVPDPGAPERFLITDHEEMWSVGDMIAAVPLLGRAYAKMFRPLFARGFLAASRLASRGARAGRSASGSAA